MRRSDSIAHYVSDEKPTAPTGLLRFCGLDQCLTSSRVSPVRSGRVGSSGRCSERNTEARSL